MPIIYKYLSKEILKQFGMVLIVVVCIYVIADFFEKSDNFVKAGFSIFQIATFFLLNTPMIVSQITPIGILLSVIIFFSLMNKNNELLALRSSGISTLSLLKPLVVLGVSVGVFLFLFSDIVVPITTTKANRMWIKEIKGRSLVTSKEKNIWIKGDRKITHIKFYNRKNTEVFGIRVNFFDEAFRLTRKLDAEKGYYNDDKWVLQEVLEQRLDPQTGMFNVLFHHRLVVSLDFEPEGLSQVIKKPAEMSFKELLTYIRKIEAEGYDATEYRVDLHAKPANAFVCLIMCMIGMGLAVGRQQQQKIVFSIGYGVSAAFIYWIFHSFCLSLGYGEMLPPFVAAWMANFVFLCMGALILMYAE